MKRLPVVAFAAAIALWGLASIPAAGGNSSSAIRGVRSAAAHRHWQADGAAHATAITAAKGEDHG